MQTPVQYFTEGSLNSAKGILDTIRTEQSAILTDNQKLALELAARIIGATMSELANCSTINQTALCQIDLAMMNIRKA